MTSVARKKFCIDMQTQTHTLTILFISAQNGTIQKNKVSLSVQTFVTLYSTTSLHRPTQIVLKSLISYYEAKVLYKYSTYST